MRFIGFIVILLFYLLVFAQAANGLVLETLVKDHTNLQNKNVCFYPGAFDPLHIGHESTAMQAVEKRFCDFVIMYPSWGRDNKKQLTDVKIRLEMLFERFANDNTIIVTALPPIELQRLLVDRVKAKYNIVFTAIVGSDNAIKKWPKSKDFMRGHAIPLQHHCSSIGGVMALPVSNFIVAFRGVYDDISSLNDMIDGRPIIGTIENKATKDISSSMVKSALTKKDMAPYVSTQVMDVIKKHSLY